ALMMDGRLIGAARLQVAISDQLHVGGFGRRADHLLLRLGAGDARKRKCEKNGEFDATAHAFHPSPLANLRWLLSRYHSGAGRLCATLARTKFARGPFFGGRAMSTHHVMASRRRFLQFVAASPLFARTALAEGIAAPD